MPLVDQAQNWEEETRTGNWDLRMRGNDDPKSLGYYEDDHPNAEGVKLYTEELFRHLTKDNPKALPRVGG